MRKVEGSEPGFLDPTQRDRLLRLPTSRLVFATFNPRAATLPNVRKLSLHEEYRPRRIVVEISPSGDNVWRFVPRARVEEGVADEGQWPRVVDICGELVECSQDQWDIYKLDPEYECFVRAPPEITTITRVNRGPTAKDTPSSPDHPTSKRRAPVSPSNDVLSPEAKRPFRSAMVETESSDEGEIESMVIDGERPRFRSASAGPRKRAQELREAIDRNRKDRRDKLARRAEKLESQTSEYFMPCNNEPSSESQDAPPESQIKRKVSTLFDPLRSAPDPDYVGTLTEDRNHVNYAQTKDSKRTRTLSPSSARRDLQIKRTERQQVKERRREGMLEARRKAREAQFMAEIYAEVQLNGSGSLHSEVDSETNEMHGASTSSKVNGRGMGEDSDGDINDEEAVRQAAIEESRRKLAALEADRPLWQEEARKRELRERAEQEAFRARSEARRRAEAEKVGAERRARAEEETRAKRQREEQLNQEREEMARRERERRQRRQRWSYGPWTTQRALEKYRVLSESFDSIKFTPSNPLTFEDVPWPVLQSPVSFSVEDVDWTAVERFFEEIRCHMRPQDYKMLVEKSHRRFHPDRWRSRGLLKSITDEAERGFLEVAANTVAQVLTPLWRELTGR